MEKTFALALAVEAMDDTLRPEGLFTFTLVFRELPQVKERNQKLDKKDHPYNKNPRPQNAQEETL